MTHYSENPGMVRIDRFKDGGKWYDTYEIDMSAYWSEKIDGKFNFIHDALHKAISSSERFGEGWIEGWLLQGGMIVCLEPYHQQAHPIMLKM